jgi:hypothetical protein
MKAPRTLLILVVLAIFGAAAVGCNSQLDSTIATFNANATAVAGSGPALATLSGTITSTQIPSPTPTSNTYDLTTDPNAAMVTAWGQVYALPSGSDFTISATQNQVTNFIVATLQLSGFGTSVKGGNATIAGGQIRLDLAIIDKAGTAGSGTVTFQPTLDATVHIKLNPLGGQFGTLQLPDNLVPATGDAIYTALAGAKSDALSRVTIKSMSLDNGILTVSGVVK